MNFVGDMMFGRRYYCTGANSYHSNNQTLEDSLCYMPEDMCDGFGELGIIPNCGNEILLNGVIGYLTQDPDVLNVGNLLNSDWGLTQQPNSVQPLGVSVDSSSVPTYTFNPDLQSTFNYDSSLASRWQAQFGLRYIF